jgi:non-heme chloroperoxidase
MVAGRGLAAATVAIDPGPLPRLLPLADLRTQVREPGPRQPAQPSPSRPAHLRPVPLRLRERRHRGRSQGALPDLRRPGLGRAAIQAATANLNPWTEAKVDTENPERGPLLIISGEKDNTVPWAIANASFKKQERNQAVTEIVEMPNRGHALVIDSGWREVADTALTFVRRFV